MHLRSGLSMLFACCFAACIGDTPTGNVVNNSDAGGDSAPPSTAISSGGPGALSVAVDAVSAMRGSDFSLRATLSSSDIGPVTFKVVNAPTGITALVPEISVPAGVLTAALPLKSAVEMPFGTFNVQVIAASADGARSATATGSVTIRGVGGELDTSFGASGSIEGVADSTLLGLFVDDDGTLYAQGQPTEGHAQAPFVVRYTPDGQRDMAFGVNGVWTAPVPSVTSEYSVSNTARPAPPGQARLAMRREGDALRVLTSTSLSPFSDGLASASALQSTLMSIVAKGGVPAGTTIEATSSCQLPQTRFYPAAVGLSAIGTGYLAWPWLLTSPPDDDFVFYPSCGIAGQGPFGTEVGGYEYDRVTTAVAASPQSVFLLRTVKQAAGDPIVKVFVVDSAGHQISAAVLRTPANDTPIRPYLSRSGADGGVLIASSNAAPALHTTCLQRVSPSGAVVGVPNEGCIALESPMGAYPIVRQAGEPALIVFGDNPKLYDVATGTTSPLCSRNHAGTCSAIEDLNMAAAVVDAFEDKQGRLVIVSGAVAWQVRRFWL